MKRSGREGRWADLPSARVRFGIEAAFLLTVAAAAALAKLSPAQIILLMFFAWLLVALVERASARTRSRPAWHVASEDEPEPAERRWSWRRRRQEQEPPQEDEAAAHPEPELEPPVEPEAIDAADATPAPAVTKRALDLPGLQEPEPDPPPAPEPEPQPGPQPEPIAVEEAAPPAAPAPPAVEQPAPPPAPREWNLWELERQAREHSGDAARREEWTALFVYLRQFATTEGLLPKEFDGLVRESFGELIQAA